MKSTDAKATTIRSAKKNNRLVCHKLARNEDSRQVSQPPEKSQNHAGGQSAETNLQAQQGITPPARRLLKQASVKKMTTKATAAYG
ncbi:MAG: hypothetical protein NZ585_02910 [Chloracidobacterium sp.]|nr:hypothetical protein [Chloracidobacterium sp.]MDW8218817.1 hypothetical protein [Acidobacteriota bacterium]